MWKDLKPDEKWFDAEIETSCDETRWRSRRNQDHPVVLSQIIANMGSGSGLLRKHIEAMFPSFMRPWKPGKLGGY